MGDLVPPKRADELAEDDLVQVAVEDWRYVLVAEATDKPIDDNGTAGIRIWWKGHVRTTVVAADELMTLAQPII